MPQAAVVALRKRPREARIKDSLPSKHETAAATDEMAAGAAPDTSPDGTSAVMSALPGADENGQTNCSYLLSDSALLLITQI